jgi:peptidoglycan-associated lipoprotein
MKSALQILCYCFLAATLGACAPSATTRPDAKAGAGSGTGAAGASDGGRAGEGARGGAKESDTGTSSLKQLQEGKPPITPASSPLKDVYFDFDRYDLNADARTILRGNPRARVEIEGHCDERGTGEYNLALGAKRAQAVREYLTSLGIDGARLSTISYGEEIPICKEQSDDCWRQNRRARFVILQDRATS